MRGGSEGGRIYILNKRLDILRELLNVLETHNSHSTKVGRVGRREGGRESFIAVF